MRSTSRTWVGTRTAQASSCIRTQPQTFITSGALGDDGIRAGRRDRREDRRPDRTVICLVGDGGFLSVCGALTTAVELGIPVVWVIFNNFCFSTIRTVGTTYFSNTYGTEFTYARR